MFQIAICQFLGDYSLIVTPAGAQYGVATLSVTQRTGILFGVRSCQDARIGITAIHVNTDLPSP